MSSDTTENFDGFSKLLFECSGKFFFSVGSSTICICIYIYIRFTYFLTDMSVQNNYYFYEGCNEYDPLAGSNISNSQ